MADEEILDFYRKLRAVLGDREFRIVYLDAEDIADGINVIRKERVDQEGNEVWFPLMLGFLEQCPYGVKHGLKGFEGLVSHLEHRRALEKRILGEVFPRQAVVLKSKAYEMDEILRR